jgi:hypothetical protein
MVGMNLHRKLILLWIAMVVGITLSCAFAEVLPDLTMEDIEVNSYSGAYFIGQDKGRYYFWSGLPGGPHLEVDYHSTPGISKQVGYYISKFSSNSELKFSTRLPIEGILMYRGAGFTFREDHSDQVFLVHILSEGEISKHFYAFDSEGKLAWKASSAVPAFCSPAGIFRATNGDVLYFAFQMGKFKLFRFDENGRKEKEVLDGHDFFNAHDMLSLPYTQYWKVTRINRDKFLTVAFKSSRGRDRKRGMTTQGDSIHIISFLVDGKGEILDSVKVHNAESNCTIIKCNRDSVETTGYFGGLNYFVMADSSIFFIFGTHPKWENKNWVEDYFIVYLAKFGKNGELIPFTAEATRVLPLESLPGEYSIRGLTRRRGKVREYWDYSVDKDGNFYIDIRKYGSKKPEK